MGAGHNNDDDNNNNSKSGPYFVTLGSSELSPSRSTCRSVGYFTGGPESPRHLVSVQLIAADWRPECTEWPPALTTPPSRGRALWSLICSRRGHRGHRAPTHFLASLSTGIKTPLTPRRSAPHRVPSTSHRQLRYVMFSPAIFHRPRPSPRRPASSSQQLILSELVLATCSIRSVRALAAGEVMRA